MTEIRHRMDLQTRKLVLLNNSRAGGVRGDDRSLVLRFDIPGLDLSEYTPYIVFDVRAYDGRRYVFSPTTTPAFDGKAFAVPYEVMRRVTGPLVYAVAIMGKTAGDDTFTQSQQAVLQVADSIREDGVQVELDPTLAATVARLETALGALEARVEAVEGTEACTGCVTAEQAAATAAGLAESARQAAVAASSAALGNAVQGLTDAYSDADEELLAAAKAYADAVAGAAAVPTDTVTSAQLAAGVAEGKAYTDAADAALGARVDGVAASAAKAASDIVTLDARLTSLGSVYRVKGSATMAELQAMTGMDAGDVYNITDTGANYVWTGTEWDRLSETVDLSGYATSASVQAGLSAESAARAAADAALDARISSVDAECGNRVQAAVSALGATVDANKAAAEEKIEDAKEISYTYTATVEQKLYNSTVEINGTVSSNKAETDGRLDVVESDIEDLKNRPRYYTHNQSAISDRWQVAHNTGAYLQLVVVFDESGNQAGVGQVTYVDADSLVVSFNIAFAGTAVFIR